MNLFNHYKTGFLLVLLLFFKISAQAQADTAFHQQKISFPVYLNMVGKNNLSYAAEKFKLSIARAEAVSAKAFPDPELSFGVGDHGQRRMKMGYEVSAGLSYTLELGGKRRARINLANHQVELEQLLLDDYFRKLRADAAIAYLTAMKEKKVLDAKRSAYEVMKSLSASDGIRLKAGAITAIDARQSKLEAVAQLNEVFAQEAVWKAALLNLNMVTGQKDTLYQPEGDFTRFNRSFNLSDLILTALNRRTDLLVAMKTREVYQSSFELTKASRALDLGLSAGLTSNSVVANIVAPTPSSTNVTMGISIPLKFSNNNKGALQAAAYGLQQAEVLYRQTELQIQTEVQQAYHHYQSTRKQLDQFAGGMLNDAQQVLDGKIYSYKRGETNLLDVLAARRTFNELQQNYLETLNENALALLELEKSAGIWDIDF